MIKLKDMVLLLVCLLIFAFMFAWNENQPIEPTEKFVVQKKVVEQVIEEPEEPKTTCDVDLELERFPYNEQGEEYLEYIEEKRSLLND